jgi:hypothetical protein
LRPTQGTLRTPQTPRGRKGITPGLRTRRLPVAGGGPGPVPRPEAQASGHTSRSGG